MRKSIVTIKPAVAINSDVIFKKIIFVFVFSLMVLLTQGIALAV